jgi:hypothetical protein
MIMFIFSCFALPNSFSVVPRASTPVFMFCAPGLVFGGIEGVGSHFNVLSAHNLFRWKRVCRVPFPCFTLLESFPVFMFYAPRLIFGGIAGISPILMFCAPGLASRGIEGVVSHFQVLHSHTRFRRYRGHQVPFSCFAFPDSFSAVPWASAPVFIFCAPGFIFSGTEGVMSRLQNLHAWTHVRRYPRR